MYELYGGLPVYAVEKVLKRTVMPRYLPVIVATFLLSFPVGYGAYLAWQEWLYRQSVLAVPTVAPVNKSAFPEVSTFKPDAIAGVLGFSTQEALAKSPEPLELRASFVSSLGASQALLAGSQEERFYTVGERLPGGSVLRRVEASQVVLWRNGREERLVLKPLGQYLLPSTNPLAQKARPTSLHLRPSPNNLRETP